MSNVTAKTKICIIIGDPIEHSLSPLMHNAAYQSLGIDDKFVFLAAQVKVENIEKVVNAMRVMGVRGLTCTIPHKVAVMKYLDEIDPIAEKIGAVNTVVNENGNLKGYNTDWLGVVTPLEKIGKPLKNMKVALLGAGGAARAMAYGVTQKGAHLTIYNRTLLKSQELATEVNAECKNLANMDLTDTDVIMNSTSVGMGDKENLTLVPKEQLHRDQIVFDAVYNPYETRLLKEAKGQGANIIHGMDMLLYQGIAQFELYTGFTAPEEVMRQTLLQHFQVLK